jgi:hypothetical protein
MIKNDARCTRETKSRIVMTKTTFSKKTLFTSKLDKFEEEINDELQLEHSIAWF